MSSQETAEQGGLPPGSVEHGSSNQQELQEEAGQAGAVLTADVQWVAGQNPDGTEADDTNERKKKMMFIRVLLLLLVLLVILVIAIPLAVRGGQNDDPSLETSVMDNSTQGETSDPVPTQVPTQPPTLESDLDFEVLLPNVANSTFEVILSDQSSPQYKAFNWLTSDPYLRRYETWRREQRFALATFFHAFVGPHFWTWLNYEIEECGWGENVNKIHVHCDDDGRVRRIVVGRAVDRDFVYFRGSIPPELSLLGQLEELDISENRQYFSLGSWLPPRISSESFPSLKVIGCTDCDLRGFFPAVLCDLTNIHTMRFGANILELTQLDQLQILTLSINKLSGMVPSEFGLMTSLTHLGFSENKMMSGSLPTELGLMTALAFLNMSATAISGSIPSELGLLTSLTELALHHSNLSGMVPSSLCSNPDLLQILVDCDSVDCTCSQCKCSTP
ncbi:Leucine Rich Repeat [Seminavis robusta]|uniref:Leucine Rich Repeat n=1 Tax=Seminavis robusta TaxID=568900 RepID=A0A9N8DX34_9STRA|nr:Leucine Rich Repeat [Seminavis robusta]|eukprot:Sro430_g141340.1 Leucine Rich Repeat (447) ;mRNA; f:41651-43081